MTYTIARMSGKAVRLAARLLAAVQLGGRLTDSPEKFYERAMEETGKSRIELERRHGILTDQFEEKIREEEGFIGDHVDVFDTVKERLKDGFFLQSEVAHDHQLTPGSGQRSPKFDRGFTPKKKAKKSGPSPGDDGTIDKLLKKLRATDDPAEARKLRRNLRKLGHRGGKRG